MGRYRASLVFAACLLGCPGPREADGTDASALAIEDAARPALPKPPRETEPPDAPDAGLDADARVDASVDAAAPQCTHDGDCDDGDACTGREACVQGICLRGQALDCNDDNPCTIDSCSTACTHVPVRNGLPCRSGNLCTVGDVCLNGRCAEGTARSCADNLNVCEAPFCDPDTGCAYTAAFGRCDDGDPCTEFDICRTRTCAGTKPQIVFWQQDMQAGPRSQRAAHWLFDTDTTPFQRSSDPADSVFAYTRISWNERGTGNPASGVCTGSGVTSTAGLTLSELEGVGSTEHHSLFTDDLTLTSLRHINVDDGRLPWDTMGSAGDWRTYEGGRAVIRDGWSKALLALENVRLNVVTWYRTPLGPGGPSGNAVGFGTGDIVLVESEAPWVAALDPRGVGRVEFRLHAMAPTTQACFGRLAVGDSTTPGISIRPLAAPGCTRLSADGDQDGLPDIVDHTP